MFASRNSNFDSIQYHQIFDKILKHEIKTGTAKNSYRSLNIQSTITYVSSKSKFV